jgi:hypothetical protein
MAITKSQKTSVIVTAVKASKKTVFFDPTHQSLLYGTFNGPTVSDDKIAVANLDFVQTEIYKLLGMNSRLLQLELFTFANCTQMHIVYTYCCSLNVYTLRINQNGTSTFWI